VGRAVIEPNFENASLEELEVAMSCAPHRPGALRIRGIWAMGKGMGRPEVALFCNVDEKTVLEWVNRFNAEGIDGLADRPRSGAPRRISKEEMEDDVLPLLDDPGSVGEEHWTAVKLRGYLVRECAAEVSYPTFVRYLHENNRHLRVPRPMPEPRDRDTWELQREAFAERMRAWIGDPAVELWFGDGCGVEADPRPRRRWVEPGSKPTVPYSGDHVRRSIIGAVRPSDGAFSSLVFGHCNTDVFQAFLDTLAEEHPEKEGVRQIPVLDNASWHRAKALRWHHFEPEYLPPYSPDFNPIERFWLRIKSDFFADFFCRKGDELEARILAALTHFLTTPETVASQCRISENF
jgi:transposase